MLRDNFKMDCVVKKAWDYVNQNHIEFISFSQNESQYRQELFQNLYNEHVQLYCKNKHTGKITRKWVYMYESSSLNNQSEEFKELGDIFKYLFTNQI